MQPDLTALVNSLQKIANTLESLVPNAQDDFAENAIAYRWQKNAHPFAAGYLQPMMHPQLISFEALQNVEEQIRIISQNTQQFVLGYPANNVLLTGARGTGKSSLVRACLEKFHPQGLRLIEIERQHLHDLPLIMQKIAHRSERFILFCDDLSFEEGEQGYKELKTVLEGSLGSISDQVIVYATSNRRHLVTETMRDNLEYQKNPEGEIHPGDTLEQKISLAERFGICLRFYSFNQDEYLAAAAYWLSHYGHDLQRENLQDAALQWSRERGARSGRIAWQFAKDYAGRMAIARSQQR